MRPKPQIAHISLIGEGGHGFSLVEVAVRGKFVRRFSSKYPAKICAICGSILRISL
jgi:hypothetical protein